MSLDLETKKQHTFVWKIEDLRLSTKIKGEYFKSPTFRAKSVYDTSWFISLYPRGHKTSRDGCIGCFLTRCKIDNGDYEIDCEFEITILSSEGKILVSNKTSHLFPKNYDWGWFNFWKHSIQSDDANDVLLVRCDIKSNAQHNIFRSESSGTTSIDSDQCSFKWNVKNLNSNCSEVMKLPFTGTSQFEISIDTLDDDVRITIHKSEDVTERKSVECQIILLDVNGGEHDTKHALHLFEVKEPSSENNSWEFPSFLKKSKLNSEKEKYLKEDCLTLKCKIAISNGAQTDSVKDKEIDSTALDLSPTPPSETGTVTVLEDYRKLYKNKIHADVKLQVSNQTILAHKNILSIRSPVFLAMFDTDMVENETGSVNIPDLDAETVNALLEYMYVGSLEKLDYEIAAKLIVAADKYEVFPLKEKCAHFLKSILSHANVCEILVIADLIQQEALKTAAVSYIKDNSENIFLTEEWDSVVEKNLKLATDTISKVSKLMAANSKSPENKV